MDIALLVRQRLKELGLEQKHLASAASVTESYISQLLTRRKLPPAPDRTDIYDKLEDVLKLPHGELGKLADLQRQVAAQKSKAAPVAPLRGQTRDLVLRKCQPQTAAEVRYIFDKEPFGELERLVTQTILTMAQDAAAAGLEDEAWQHRLAPTRDKSYEQTRVALLEFLDTDVFHVSEDNVVSFLEPLLVSWDIDLQTFTLDVRLNPALASPGHRRFAFVEQPVVKEPGLAEFLGDPRMNTAGLHPEEIALLSGMQFPPGPRRPSAMFYYRVLQCLRDPLHFD